MPSAGRTTTAFQAMGLPAYGTTWIVSPTGRTGELEASLSNWPSDAKLGRPTAVEVHRVDCAE
jgi:hypothetical protein